MARVTFEEVRKEYDHYPPAVDGLNFVVEEGELMVLVGPSGSGKTTTLRMVAGLESVTSGSIRIDGKIVNHIPTKERDVAMVFQNYALYPHLTVFNNISIGLKLRKYSKDEIKQRVGRAAEILGITNILDRKPRQLSGGQQQRVAVGRAIVREPKVFLFDEPLSNLDAQLRIQMRREIARLHHELNATMIYVTHDQAEAMTLGNRIAVMNRGFIHQIDDPVSLYRQPKNRLVAKFIGNPGMNFMDGTVEKGVGEWRFISDMQDLALAIPLSLPQSCDRRRVVLGFRPESVTPLEDNRLQKRNGVIEAEVIYVEHLGVESYVHARALSSTFIVRVSGFSNFGIGERLLFELHPEYFHLFDSENGESLSTLIL